MSDADKETTDQISDFSKDADFEKTPNEESNKETSTK